MTKTFLLQGLARYFKAVGNPVPGYNDGPPEWTFDLELDAKGIEAYKATGADPFYIKEKDGVSFIKFVRKASKKDGTPGKRINIIDHAGREWDQNKLVGNGSILNVSLTLNEAVFQGKKRLKPSVLSVQVWEHKSYTSKGAFPTRPDAPAEENSEAQGNW